MSSENQMEQQNSGAKVTEGETRSARRRFLKAGAAVVPVVITLQSGTAWAQSLTCAEKQEFPMVDRYNYHDLYKLLRQSGKSKYQSKYLIRYFNSEEYNGSEAHHIYLKYHAYSCWSSLKQSYRA